MSKVYGKNLSVEGYNAHSLIINQIKPNSKVLEFGCGAGATTNYLKNKLNCEVSIVEYVKEAYDTAKQFATDGYCGNAESLEWFENFKHKKYDYILFADVLEHLRNPKEVLACSKNLLLENGQIIVSVPNNCHSVILAEMFSNNFHYTPAGLLDDTHIHLFSYNSLCRMIKDCNLDIIIYDAVCIPVENTEFRSSPQLLSNDTLSVLKSKAMGNIYQFIFTLAYPKPNQPIINRFKERIGFTSRFYIVDDYGFPITSVNASMINTKQLSINLNTNKQVNKIKFIPMIDSGCMLKNIKISKDNLNCKYKTNAYTINDMTIFLSNDDYIYIENLSSTSVLNINADIIYNK